MTLRELLENISNISHSLLNWFVTGLQSLLEGRFLDLTIGQIVFTIVFLLNLAWPVITEITRRAEIRNIKASIQSTEAGINTKKELGYDTQELETRLEDLRLELRIRDS